MMILPAQTNIQLYNQLVELGYPESDLALVRRAYDLAMQIFSGQYRANHKPQLAHVVGVASILAALEQPVTVVAAGLLHAAYSHGDWGDATRGRNVAKADQLRDSTSRQTEELVARYLHIPWRKKPEILFGMLERNEELTADELSVLTIKLADIYEEYADLSIGYCKFEKLPLGPGYERNLVDALARAARMLGLDTLARDFESALQRFEEFVVATPLYYAQQGGPIIPPLSHELSLKLRLNRKVKRILHRLGIRG